MECFHKKDMNLLNITEQIALDILEWRKEIHIIKPQLIGTQGLVWFDVGHPLSACSKIICNISARIKKGIK